MVVGAVIGIAVMWALTTIHESFEAKRRLLGAQATGQRESRRGSVYQREDELFRRLGRPKLRESPSDAIVSIVTLLVSAAFSLVSAINGFRLHHVAGGILLVVLAALLLAGAARLARCARQRSPH
jgi:hypothetical protein